jgi:hypothetical protein
MEKQIKIGKITLNVVMPYVKVVRYWKTDWKGTHLKDQSAEEIKQSIEAMRNERNNSCFYDQSISYKDTHTNTIRVMKALVEVLETGVQTKPVTIQ